MAEMDESRVRYGIWDPTGNVTALVESAVAVWRQPSVAAAIMERHPLVEQVGFVQPADEADEKRGLAGALRMAGGEFCGNASMSAAALCLLRGHAQMGEESVATVRLRVSGASSPVEVRLAPDGGGAFFGSIRMPRAQSVEEVDLTHAGIVERAPLVRMEGISHVVIERGSALFSLRDQRESAERAVRVWCLELGCDGLGLMFVDGAGNSREVTPLVYVPGSDTVFWENSCASGSASVGVHAATLAHEPVELALKEPGGILRVESYPDGGDTWLHGRTRLVEEYQ